MDRGGPEATRCTLGLKQPTPTANVTQGEVVRHGCRGGLALRRCLALRLSVWLVVRVDRIYTSYVLGRRRVSTDAASVKAAPFESRCGVHTPGQATLRALGSAGAQLLWRHCALFYCSARFALALSVCYSLPVSALLFLRFDLVPSHGGAIVLPFPQQFGALVALVLLG